MNKNQNPKRRMKARDQPKPSGLDYILSNPMNFIQELREIVNEANDKRATILIHALEQEHPDLYHFAESLVDVEPIQARDELVKKFPWLGLIKLYSDHLKVIEFLQTQIKLRRENNNENGPDQNIKRPLALRS